MIAFIVLLNQLICKFSTSVHGILEDVFPTIASRIFNIIPRDSLPSGPGTNIEVLLICFLNSYSILLLNGIFKGLVSVHFLCIHFKFGKLFCLFFHVTLLSLLSGHVLDKFQKSWDGLFCKISLNGEKWGTSFYRNHS